MLFRRGRRLDVPQSGDSRYIGIYGRGYTIRQPVTDERFISGRRGADPYGYVEDLRYPIHIFCIIKRADTKSALLCNIE